MRVGGQLHAPATLPPGKRPGTHCVGGWMGPRAGLDGCATLLCILIKRRTSLCYDTAHIASSLRGTFVILTRVQHTSQMHSLFRIPVLFTTGRFTVAKIIALNMCAALSTLLNAYVIFLYAFS
jgi:hypothetical protein